MILILCYPSNFENLCSSFTRSKLPCAHFKYQSLTVIIFRLGLEAKKEENLSDWYSQVRVNHESFDVVTNISECRVRMAK